MIRYLLGVCSVMLGLGFIRYLGRMVFFPWFPNILDASFMVGVGLVLLYDAARDPALQRLVVQAARRGSWRPSRNGSRGLPNDRDSDRAVREASP